MKINFQHIKQCPGVAKLLDIFIISITFHKCLDEITAISRCKYLKSFLLLDLYLISDLKFVGFFKIMFIHMPPAPSLFLYFFFFRKINLPPPPLFFYWSQFICPHTSEVFNFITTPVCMPSCSISIHHIA